MLNKNVKTADVKNKNISYPTTIPTITQPSSYFLWVFIQNCQRLDTIEVSKIANLGLPNDTNICDSIVPFVIEAQNAHYYTWNSNIVIKWTSMLSQLGIKTIALSDTIGVSNKENINHLFSNIIPEFKDIEIGAHLHTTPDAWKEKIEAAYQSGCKRFDGAIKGFGGCPMAADDLTGNMPTENIIEYFNNNNINTGINPNEFNNALSKAIKIFPN